MISSLSLREVIGNWLILRRVQRGKCFWNHKPNVERYCLLKLRALMRADRKKKERALKECA